MKTITHLTYKTPCCTADRMIKVHHDTDVPLFTSEYRNRCFECGEPFSIRYLVNGPVVQLADTPVSNTVQ